MLNLSPNAERVMRMRYLSPGETSEDRFRTVAAFVAQAEIGKNKEYYAQRFYDELLAPLKFLPNSPTIGNAGKKLGQLSACFVLPVEDDMGGIFETLKNTALIHQSGGGTGFSFSRLRPKGSPVNTTGGVSSGPVSFMRVYDQATAEVKQGGSRRGANMGILSVDHPDIVEFIQCKSDMVTLQNFNISVAATTAFMEGVLSGDAHAQSVWRRLTYQAWKNGDPGLFFIDEAERFNPVPHIGKYEATNPCGEQVLLPYESCNLGSINLAQFVKPGIQPGTVATMEVNTNRVYFDWDDFSKVIHLSVRFLDDVIDVNQYPVEELGRMARTTRKIGLGVMGFADALFKLGVAYDSLEGITWGLKIGGFLRQEADSASEFLAMERGVYPAFNVANILNHGRLFRNSTRTTVAPTGTLSILADCSGGIEPVFALSFKRQHRLDRANPLAITAMYETNQIFRKALAWELKDAGVDQLIERLAEGESLQKLPVSNRLASVFRTAHDISPEWHIKMQAAWQVSVDASVSKTVNLPHDATLADVQNAYMLAWKSGCKGVTVYRDGSRENQVLTHKNPDANP